MDQRFLIHNLFRESREIYSKMDPQLKRLSQLSLQFTSPMINEIPTSIPGIYTLTGGRQVGKSTFIKQLIDHLLKANSDPNHLYVITGEYISDYQDLIKTIERFLQGIMNDEMSWVFIDEITYISKWQLALKHLADTGQIDKTFLLVSGSDSTAIQEAIKWLPGRRGRAVIHDFIYHPLSFLEVVRLRNQAIDVQEILALRPNTIEENIYDLLFSEFNTYLITGGYLTAINEYWDSEQISPQTLDVYSEWIRGDILRRGKNEGFLKEILEAIIKRQGSQITWNNLLPDLSINHPATISDYISLLEAMHVLRVQPALSEHRLKAAPKKARKLHIADPFIYYAVKAWINESPEPFKEIIEPALKNSISSSVIVESIIVNHVSRQAFPFYIKGRGEIDIAVVNHNRIQPIEVKWRNQIRSSDIKELKRFDNGILVTKQPLWERRDGIFYVPIPVFLIHKNFADIPVD